MSNLPQVFSLGIVFKTVVNPITTTTPTTTQVSLYMYSQSVLEHSRSLHKNYSRSILEYSSHAMCFSLVTLFSLKLFFVVFHIFCFSYAFLSLISLISRLNSSILLTIFFSKEKCDDLDNCRKICFCENSVLR